MKQKTKMPIKVALFGMDERSHKTMGMFLKGPCNGYAVEVTPEVAEVDIIDADFSKARAYFGRRKKEGDGKPVIAMTLDESRHKEMMNGSDVIILKKPVNKESMITALEKAKGRFPAKRFAKTKLKGALQATTTNDEGGSLADKPQKNQQEPLTLTEVNKKKINRQEVKKTFKHQSARQYNEGGFSAFIGILPDIDFNDSKQVLVAHYDPNHYFQGYVRSAFKIAKSKSKVVQLKSGWKPLYILPQSEEIWLDADEKQLRAFSGMLLNKSIGGSMSLVPVNAEGLQIENAYENFNSMDGFLWKVAIWTSKGRYPIGVDINKPVFLKRWPNFTRLVVTPHALRIAALLTSEPKTLLEVSEQLNVKPQYVFVFISACHSLGLIGQVVRKAENKEQVILETKKAKRNKPKKGLFSKILSKLRKG